MDYKKLDIPADAVPAYDLATIFSSINKLGYTISDINSSESAVETEEDMKFIVLSFTIGNFPILTTQGENLPVIQEVGRARVNLYAVETIHENTFYIEDITATTFTKDDLIVDVNGPQASYRSFALDALFYSLLRTLLLLSQKSQAS